jgi:hypothetical protein
MSDITNTSEVGTTSTVTNASRGLISPDMQFLHYEVPGYVPLETMAKIQKMIRVNVDEPDMIRLEVLASEIRIKHGGTKIIAQARRPNGSDQWIVQAHNLIARAFDHDHPRPHFYF